jgi:hypothetical protein
VIRITLRRRIAAGRDPLSTATTPAQRFPVWVIGLVVEPRHKRTESAHWHERFQAEDGKLRTPFGWPRRPARRRFLALNCPGYSAACAAFFLGTGSPASPATCPLTTAYAVTSRLTDGILTTIDFDTSRTI